MATVKEETCKTPRCILEEALSTIAWDATGDFSSEGYSEDSDTPVAVGVNTPVAGSMEYRRGVWNEILRRAKQTAAKKPQWAGWVKGSEFTGIQTSESVKLGACSVGAIALASLDMYQMGRIVKPTSYASFATQARMNRPVLLAGMYLAQAIYKSPIFVSRASVNVFPYETDERDLKNWKELLEFAKQLPENDHGYINNLADLTTEVITGFNDDDDTSWSDVTGVFTQAIKFAIKDEERV